MLSLRKSTFDNEPSISGSFAIHIAPSAASQHGKLGLGHCQLLFVSGKGAAIVHRPQDTIIVELLGQSSQAVHTAAPLRGLAKYFVECARHGLIVPEAVTGRTVYQNLNVCLRTMFLRLFRLPRC